MLTHRGDKPPNSRQPIARVKVADVPKPARVPVSTQYPTTQYATTVEGSDFKNAGDNSFSDESYQKPAVVELGTA